jgi:hypothetical protein
MDVAGLKDHEIQASLQDAWDSGYDAVMLKNYNTPAGTWPRGPSRAFPLKYLRFVTLTG